MHLAFPRREMSFPHWDFAFPDQEKRFPRVHFAFPHREMAFPTARERDYGNQKVSLLVAFSWMNSTYKSGPRIIECRLRIGSDDVYRRLTDSLDHLIPDVLLNLYPNLAPLGRLRRQIRKWSIKECRKEDSNLHPLRALEPESDLEKHDLLSNV